MMNQNGNPLNDNAAAGNPVINQQPGQVPVQPFQPGQVPVPPFPVIPPQNDPNVVNWHKYTFDFIRQYCRNNGLEILGLDKDALCDNLHQLGFMANQALGNQPIAQPPIVAPPRHAKLTLRHQFPNEEVQDFLKCAEVFFQIDATPEGSKVGHLLVTTNSEETLFVQTLFHNQIRNYQEVSQ
jgi:hypothetical protein